MESTRLSYDTYVGRAIYATRGFVPGDIVMVEKPALVFPTLNSMHAIHRYVSLFHAADQEIQDSILDMAHPPLNDSVRAAQRRRDASNYLTFIGDSSEEKQNIVQLLLLIADTNAHSYTGHTTAFTESSGSSMYSAESNSALFKVGSKVAHSCLPNVSYYSKNSHGSLTYVAIREIEDGDMITFSYIGDLWTTPTQGRRAALLASKNFICCCVRCRDVDTCRAAACKCGGIAHPQPAAPEVWSCQQCGPLNADAVKAVVKQEMRLTKQLAMFEAALQNPDGSGLQKITPKMIIDFATEIGKRLNATHYLVCRAYNLLTTVYASRAATAQQAHMFQSRCYFGSETDLRVLACEAGRCCVKVQECIAAGCPEGLQCLQVHPPLAELFQTAFFAAQDLLRVPASQRNKVDLHFVQRYMPAMSIGYGEKDTDLAQIKQMFGHMDFSEAVATLPACAVVSAVRAGNILSPAPGSDPEKEKATQEGSGAVLAGSVGEKTATQKKNEKKRAKKKAQEEAKKAVVAAAGAVGTC